MILNYGILSSYELKVFYDCIKICKLYFSVFPLNFLIQDSNFICFIERYLYSLLYDSINNKNITDETRKIVSLAKTFKSEFIKTTLCMFEDFSKGKAIYTSYKFTLPYMLPIDDGTYVVNCIPNVKQIEVTGVKINDISSVHGLRWFSKVTIIAEKFVSTDVNWMGDTIESQRFLNQEFIVNTINDFIMYLRSVCYSKYISRINFRQLSTVTIATQNSNYEDIHMTVNMGFGGNSLVDVVSREGIIIDNTAQKNFISILNEGFRFKVAEKLLVQSKMCLDEELYVEAFFLINSSLEAFIDDFTRTISAPYQEEYDEFILKKSKCEVCKKYDGGEKLAPELPPSIFEFPKFLKKLSIISKNEEKNLRGFISKVKNDQLRNKLTHGVISEIDKSDALKSLDSLEKVKTLLYKKLNT
ncbi:MAG: hypothetical protein LKJ25_00075 [Clostridia bacterium]|nr:hypothetical protein [Clostridia bacterium]